MVLCHYCFRVVTTVSARTSSTAQQPYLPSFSQTSKARARLSVPPPLHKPWALLSPTAQVPPCCVPSNLLPLITSQYLTWVQHLLMSMMAMHTWNLLSPFLLFLMWVTRVFILT